MTLRAEIPLFILAAIAIALAVVLIMTGHPVPLQLWLVVTVAVGGGAGVMSPTSSSKPAGFTMPSEAEIQNLAKTIGAIFPAMLAEITAALDETPAGPVAPLGGATGPFPPPATVTSIVRPTEPPTAS